MRLEIEDYYNIVYLMGWVVVLVGVYMAMSAGFSRGGDSNMGLAVVFGGLYITSFVRNSQLKLKVMMLEKEIGDE